jgi:hypothetical protein
MHSDSMLEFFKHRKDIWLSKILFVFKVRLAESLMIVFVYNSYALFLLVNPFDAYLLL